MKIWVSNLASLRELRIWFVLVIATAVRPGEFMGTGREWISAANGTEEHTSNGFSAVSVGAATHPYPCAQAHEHSEPHCVWRTRGTGVEAGPLPFPV